MSSSPTLPTGTTAPEVWLETHGDSLFAFAFSRVGRREVAEDLVQETLLAGIEARSRFEGRSSERTWLIGILKRKIAGWRRRQGVVSEPDLARMVDEQFTRRGKWKTTPAAWGSDPETEEIASVLRRCLAKLPERQAEAVLMIESSRLDPEKTSKLLGVTTNHLYVMLYRARTGLRACLEQRLFRAKDR
ncbi:MAG: sigma-70 family RNA polymerase sigma factor [Phycisphaerales bacterium]|nr:sigma-70 family RNA polymerase sigma factor [Phycisphaerales bacterium]